MTDAPAPGRERPEFRADINGLRAIGMLPLVLGHFDRGILLGFSLWVDVFFVLSGYLMTGIIGRALARGSFRFVDFYAARLRRIAPPLMAMGAVTTVLGFWLLDPWTWQALVADVPAALMFFSNIVFAGRVGYFAPAAEAQWMLPTWSLGVEMQFYLLIPLLLWGLDRAGVLRARQGLVLLAIALTSYLAGLHLARGHANALYFDVPTRLWQLLAGALCARIETTWRPGPRLGALMHLAGLAILAACTVLLHPLQNWPSAWAAAPVLGTALVLAGGVTQPAWARPAPVARIGLSSYSIYIWHWPIIMGLRYAQVAVTPLTLAIGVPACLLAGVVSHALIETRATQAVRRLGLAREGLVIVGGVLAVSGLAWAIGGAHGLEAWRTQARTAALRAALADDRRADADWTYPGLCGSIQRRGGLGLCRIGDPAARRVLVIGDSQAEQLAPRLAGRAFGPGEGVTFVTRGGCPIMPGVSVSPRVARCAGWSAAAWELAEREPWSRIVLASGWTDYFDPKVDAAAGLACFEGSRGCVWPRDPRAYGRAEAAAFDALAARVARLRALGREVVIIGQNPTLEAADPHRLYQEAFWNGVLAPPPVPTDDPPGLIAMSRARLGAIARASGAALVEPMDSLCPSGACPVADGGRAIYKDHRHFRASSLALPAFAYLDPWLLPVRR